MKIFFFVSILSFLAIITDAQNVQITPTGILPAPAGQLPRLSYDAIMALPSPQVGDMAIDLTYKCLRFYNGTKWAYFLTNEEPASTTVKAGGTADDVANAVATDGNGNVFIVGYFNGTATFGATNIASNGGADIFIAKYSAGGTLLWVRKAGGTLLDTATALVVDGSGNVYVTGSFSGTATFESTNILSSGSSDVFIAKYNSAGTLQWVQKGGGSSIDVANSIAIDNSGDLYITGNFYGTSNFGTNITSAGSADLFIAKCNASGSFVSAIKGGGTSDDSGSAIAYDGGWIYVAGYFSGTADFSGNVTSVGGTDIVLLKYSPILGYVRKATAGGTGNDYANSMAVENSNNLYITGSFQNSAFSGAINSLGGSDAYVAKYSVFFEYLWAKSGGGSSEDYCNSVAVDATGNAYITGYFQNIAIFGSNNITSAGLYDAFFAKYSHDGVLLWFKRGGGTGYDIGSSAKVDINGNVYFAGYFQGVATIGTNTLTSAGGADAFFFIISQ